MSRFCSCLVLAAVIQVILGENVPRELKDFGIYHPYQQNIPSHCWHSPRGIDTHKCCPTPNLYSNKVYDICGIERAPEKGSNIPAKPKIQKVPCQDGRCLMKESNLLLANGSIDYEKFRTYIDQWAAANPNFTEAIMAAKPLCAIPKGVLWHIGEPPKMCDPDRVFYCLMGHILWNCKPKEEFEECKQLRKSIDECRPYYMKPKGYDERVANRKKAV